LLLIFFSVLALLLIKDSVEPHSRAKQLAGQD